MLNDETTPNLGQLARHGTGSQYTDAEIEAALTAVALCSGNTRRAAGLLEESEDACTVPRGTLENWIRYKHTHRYEQITEEILPTVYAEIAQKSEDLAARMVKAEEALMDRVNEKAGELKGHEAASALRNVSTAKAINIDKASIIRGRPTEIREERTMADVARSLERFKGIVNVVNRDVIESSAVEEPDG